MNNNNNTEEASNNAFGPVTVVCIWIAFSLVMCASIVGNALVIWVIVAHAKMRIITNFFLLNLSISDLLVVTLQIVPNVMYALANEWKIGVFFCRLSNFITTFSISLSTFTFTAIAIERYVVIMHPLRPRPKRLAIIGSITFIWTFSVITATPSAVFSELSASESNITVCVVPDSVNTVYSYVLITLQYLIPVKVVGAAYIIIGIKLWTQQPIGEQTQSQGDTINAKRKIVLMMICVVVIFALCWLPYQISFILGFKSQEDFISLYFMAICSTWPNPLIYCKMNKNFRTGFKQAFSWLPCVTVNAEQYEVLKHGRAKSHTIHSCTRTNNREQAMALLHRTQRERSCREAVQRTAGVNQTEEAAERCHAIDDSPAAIEIGDNGN